MDNIERALQAVARGLVQHAHPFTWQCADEAWDVDARTLQRALQQRLIGVGINADRQARPAELTDAGRARLGREGAKLPSR